MNVLGVAVFHGSTKKIMDQSFSFCFRCVFLVLKNTENWERSGSISICRQFLIVLF